MAGPYQVGEEPMSCTKEHLKEILEQCDAEPWLGDQAYWHKVHDMAGLEYGDAQSMIAADPAFYGYSKKAQTND